MDCLFEQSCGIVFRLTATCRCLARQLRLCFWLDIDKNRHSRPTNHKYSDFARVGSKAANSEESNYDLSQADEAQIRNCYSAMLAKVRLAQASGNVWRYFE